MPIMSSVRNVPYGADAHTETIVKIIGSKYVRCIVEKPKIKAKEGTKVETQSALRKLPACNTRQTHGNPPGFNNPLCQQISYDLDYERRSRDKQEEHESKQLQTSNSRFLDGKVLKPPNIHCVSVPSGDQSLSYIHALQKPSLRARSLRQHVGHHQQIICQGPTESPEEEDSLLALVRNELRLGPVRLAELEKLQRELKTLHPISRFLPQSQLSSLLLKHEVPLQLPTVKLLFERFSEANDSELVNSEELIQFLRLAAAAEMQNIKTPDLSLQAKSVTLKDQSKSSLAPEDPLQILKQILKEYKGELDMEKLSLSFQKEDKSFSGLLSLNEIETICQKHRLTLTPLLLEALLNNHDLCKQGKIQWKTFMELLKEAHSDAIPNLPVPVADSSDSEEQEAWIDRFRKLEKALYLCDIKNTGMLEKEKAKRLIHNYNLIYDLSLSPLKIDQAFRNFRSGENMPLQPVLQYLKEL
ncbi:uncharacterized protein C1orf87 homolog isoform X1 [Gopherus flavomarginatus]|uniref:uncharacterized protein C1orf87 homolog isoform X1 n=1 Tax=Gopherus flavomarginatus TaxID=286002 RepID=UPI0021CC4DC6|nr:uncharacterized protein C1orf87 homolog isoform X1 [Gopherus flavomarginatus]XP_050818002.1 uncharacterized protein C1orf87 homolog isoform X1 [Gopherus flavomarginatus]